jgi:hypothetical protein
VRGATPSRRAASSWLQPRRFRAARICRCVIGIPLS